MTAVETPRTPVRTRLGRYELLFRIAAGGMAEVYAARLVGEGGFEKLVAVKRMLPELASDARFVPMFLDEGRVAANVSSPYVVQTLDLGRADDQSLFLVMELVHGISLAALMGELARQLVLPPPVAIGAEIIAQAAQGLHDAHDAKTTLGKPLAIVHRDISPQNVMVDVSGRARITDFGVARALQRLTRTASGEVKGKLAYFAPEQARGEAVDRRCDVFAIGIVAWEVLTGTRLFGGASPAETVKRVLTMPIPRIDAVRPEVPAALADAIAGALERKLDRRTPDAGTLSRRIREAMTCATPTELGAYVRGHGGDALAKLERNLRGDDGGAWEGKTTPSGEESSGVVPSGSTPVDPDESTTPGKKRVSAPGVGEMTRTIVPPEEPRDETTRKRGAPSAPAHSGTFEPEPMLELSSSELQLVTSGTTGPSSDAPAPSSPASAAVVVSSSRGAMVVAALALLVAVLAVIAVVIVATRTPSPVAPVATEVTRTLAVPTTAVPAAPPTELALPPPTAVVVDPAPVAEPAPDRRAPSRRVPTHAPEPSVAPPPTSAAPTTTTVETHPRPGALHGLDDFDRQ